MHENIEKLNGGDKNLMHYLLKSEEVTNKIGQRS